jgi:predicted aminopeptidase
MRLPTYSLALGAFLIALLAVGMSVYPSFAAESTADFFDMPDLQQMIRAEERLDRELARVDQEVLHRLACRQEVVSDLVAGRISFALAVRTFVDLNRSDPAAQRLTRMVFGGRTDEERGARQVIAHVRALNTKQTDELAAELECAFAAGLAAEE